MATLCGTQARKISERLRFIRKLNSFQSDQNRMFCRAVVLGIIYLYFKALRGYKARACRESTNRILKVGVELL